MGVRLTERAVADARCPDGRKDRLIFDAELKGFGVRVTRTGNKTFLFQYNGPTGKRRAVLGTYGTELTVSQARRKAEALRGQVRDRRDPVGEQRQARAEAAAVAAAEAFSVDMLVTQWAEHHLSARSRSYAARAPRELRAALADWLRAPAGTFTRQAAVQVLDHTKMVGGPVAANRLRAVARACWTWAHRRGSLVENPWSATPRPLARETPRERVLTDPELGELYNAATELAEPFGALIRLLILTGQRRGEVAAMRWAELQLDAAMWHLPGARTKNHRSHTVPLAPVAVDLLRSVKRRKGAEFVFEGPRETPVSGFGKVKERLDAALAGTNRDTHHPWTLHDLRRTVATGLQRLGVRLEVTEAVLNHVSGSRSGIVGIYQRHRWETEKAEALNVWALHVLFAAEGRTESGNMTPFPDVAL